MKNTVTEKYTRGKQQQIRDAKEQISDLEVKVIKNYPNSIAKIKTEFQNDSKLRDL